MAKNPIDIGKRIYEVIQQLFGKAFARNMIGTETNVIKPVFMDRNAPTKNIYPNKAFTDEKLLDLAEEKIMEYAPSILANKNLKEQMNFLENAQKLLMKRKGVDTSKTVPDKEADVIDITTKKPMDEKGIMSLKEDLGIPEGIDPESTMGKAIKEAGILKRETKKMSDEMDSTLAKAADAFFGSMPNKNTVMEGKRRAVIRKILLKDDRINLPENVEKSLRNYDDLRGGADESMDPLEIFNKYYERDLDKLDKLDEIIDVAENEVKAADEFLKDTNFDLVEKDLGDKLKDLPDDIDPDAMATGGRVGFKQGLSKELIDKMVTKFIKENPDELMKASEIAMPEKTLRRMIFKDFEDRLKGKTRTEEAGGGLTYLMGL